MPEKQTRKELEQRVKRAFRAFCFSLFGFFILIPPGYLSYAQDNTKKEVLILNSYHRGYRWTDDITEGIESVLRAESEDVSLYIEYMDTKRVSDERYFHQLHEIYKHKFRDLSFDVIISSDDNAFNFLRKHRDEIFPGTPVVFCGVNFFKGSDLEGHDLFTGVNEEADFKAGIEIALRLHPDTKRIVVIDDRTTTGMKIHEKLMEIIADYQDSVNFVLLEDIEMERVQQIVKGLTPDSLVFYTSFYRDKSGKFFEYDESISLIAKRCSVPIYGAWDMHLGYGIVGGMLTSGYFHGEAVAKIALRILQGENVRDIPVIKESPNRYMFDYSQLDRFGISLSELPKGSIVINKPSSFYSEQKRLVWGVIASIAGLTFIIFILSLNIFKRKQAEERLKEAHDKLEERVVERTKDLNRTNEQLNLQLKERKRAEEALEKERNLLRTVIDNVPDYIYIKDTESRYLVSNNAFARFLGATTPEEVIGKTVFELFPKELAPKYYADDQEVIGSGQPLVNREERSVDQTNKSVVWNQTTKVPLRDSSGNIVGLVGIARDITKQVQAEKALRERTMALERSNKELEQFAYVASHDLQEPLRMVTSYTQLLARRYKGKLDSNADEFIAYAVDGATRMQEVINALLAYSRVGTRAKDLEPTDCNAVLERTLDNLQKAIEERGARVTSDPLPTVMADDIQLGQLFQNLISNAIKFQGEESPHVRLSAEKSGNEWVFSVLDNGIGIDPEFTERIFIIFQRLHKRREYPGTGIGLAISKKIVERHGGRIWVESKPEKGSTFYFTIPIRGENSHE